MPQPDASVKPNTKAHKESNQVRAKKKPDGDDAERKPNIFDQKLYGGTDSCISLISAALDLHEFKFEDETPEKIKEADQRKARVGLDVTALDRYNDEVRRYRKLVIDECRNLPTRSELHSEALENLDMGIERLCRNAYYGTAKAQKLAEGAMPLLVWLLNRRRFPENFLVKVHKGISEMCWTSACLKEKFCESHGIMVLFYNMKMSRKNKRLGCWAVYALAMITTGSAIAIKTARDIEGMEEYVAELSFEYYWYDWPVNFGMVLQAIIYGPHAVCPLDPGFQFN